MAKRSPTTIFSPDILLIFLLLSTICLCFRKANSQSQLQPEKLTLVQISNEWGNPQSLHDWTINNTLHYCKWTGIQCTDGYVTDIILSNENLDKPIPHSICNLKYLNHLDLSYNDIPGNFPVTLYNCSKLQFLNLEQNYFNGSIPEDIDKLPPQLSYLSLSANSFSGDIPQALGSLPSIRTLYLDSNLFGGLYPTELGNLPTLEHLSLAYNPFLPSKIPSKFANLKILNFLWMTNMNLFGEIPEFLGRLPELVHLDLSWNSLHGRIPATLWTMKNLQKLYLFSNNLTGEIQGPVSALGLVEIDLSMNELNGTIPDDFGKLQNLTILLLHTNKLSGNIPPSIGRLPNLVDIRLFRNSLTGVLPPELGEHSKLFNFEVSENKISGSLPQYLCANQALVSVVVFNNNFTGAIPSSLANCPTLLNLMLYNNNFSGDFPRTIWSASKNLTTVIIHHNSFTGILPDNLPYNLSRLHLHNNQLSGRIPSFAPNLQVFEATNNLFVGEIPENLSQLSKLSQLLLGNNLILGSIPASISSLKLLIELNLSHNQLTGDIPGTIGSLQQLNSLDLSYNNLSGVIPTGMSNLKLNILNLSYNQFFGPIPSQLLNPADELSFLGNPGLCSVQKSILNVFVCPSNNLEKSSRKLLIILPVLCCVLLSMTLVVLTLYCRKRTETNDIESWKNTSFSKMEINESEIVHGLISSNIIGRGGSAEVYKITLGNGSGPTIAVKKILNDKRHDPKLMKQFDSEVQVLSSIRHANIVQILNCISSTKSKLIVYEYVENGSLSEWIRGKNVRTESGELIWLDWTKRLKIAIDAAEGLCYMHHNCAEPIVHRDVKSSNILLDKDFGAKIADFGLSRILVNAGEPQTVSDFAGTFGYIAPESGHTRKVNEKMDVYSFGVVLLELTTGRIPTDCDGVCIAEWALQVYNHDDTLMSGLDEQISDDPTCIDKIRQVFMLGLYCTSHSPLHRPSMKLVVQCLKEIDRTSRNANRFMASSNSSAAESPMEYKSFITDRTISSDLSFVTADLGGGIL